MKHDLKSFEIMKMYEKVEGESWCNNVGIIKMAK